MSDLEPNSSRAQTAAPITGLATGKLRSLAAGPSLFAESDGLIDAFAEVFARMAIASPPPVQSGEATSDESSHVISDDAIEPAQEETTTQNESDESSAHQEVDNDPVLVIDESTESNATVVEVQDDLDNVDTNTDAELIDDSNDDELVTQQLVVKPQTEAEQTETIEQVTDTPEIVAVVTVAADLGKDRRERGDSQQVQVTSGQDLGKVRGESEAKANQIGPRETEIDSSVAEIDPDSDGSLDDDPRGRSRRGRRGGKNQAANEILTQKFADQAGPSRQSETAASKATATEWAAEATPAQESSAPQVRKSQAAVTAAASIAAQSSGPANAAQNAASNARGSVTPSTQAIDPTASTAKTEPRAKGNGKEAQGPTADLVSRAKLIQRVSRAFQHLGAEGGQVRIRLSPPDLGTVRVEMRIQQRRIQARVVTESDAASHALREHLPDLRARLESQGMQIEKIDIETETGENLESQLGDAHTRDQSDTPRQQSFGRRTRSSQSDDRAVSQIVSQSTADSQRDFVNQSATGVDVRL